MRERYSPHAVGAKPREIYRELLSEK
jgi:hypothetical protein